MKTLVAAAIGAVSMGLISAGAFAYTKRNDPSLQTLPRNSQIGAALAVALGVYVGLKKNPLWGAAIATGALGLVAATRVAVLVGGFLDKPVTQKSSSTTQVGMGDYRRMQAVYGNMSGYRPSMSAVYGNMSGYRPSMSAVYGNMSGIAAASKEFVPAPNWTGNPF